MTDERITADSIIAVFDNNKGVYTFHGLAAVDGYGNIIAGENIGTNIKSYDEIKPMDRDESLECIKDETGSSVTISNNNGKIGYYRIDTSFLSSKVVDGKLDCNFIDEELLMKIAEPYLKNPDDRYAKNKLYRLIYFKLLYFIASHFSNICLTGSMAALYEGEDVDSVLIHELSECTNYRRPYSINYHINNIFDYLDTKLERPKTPVEAKKPIIIRENDTSKSEGNDISKIIDSTSKKFVAQEDAVRDLALNIYYNVNKIAILPSDVAARNKASILLDGATGTGKTAILKELSKLIGVPFVSTGATQYSTVGYKGGDLTNILISLLTKAGGNKELAEKGIVFIDEFDKLAFNSDGQRDLAFKKGLQDELLKYIEGGVFQLEIGSKLVDFDTSKVTFICGGAFTDLREGKIKENNKTKRRIGFSQEEDTQESRTYKLTNQDFVDFGIQRELMGRLKTKISTKSYTKEDLMNILTNSTISPLTEFTDILASDPSYSPVIYISEEFIETLAQMAADLNTGARGLQEIMENVRTLLLEDLLINKPDTISLTESLLTRVDNKKVRSY